MIESAGDESGADTETFPRHWLQRIGYQVEFFVTACAFTPRMLHRYKRELGRQIAAIAFGAGTLAALGGSAAVIAFFNLTTGAEVLVEGYNSFIKLGITVLSGFFSAYVNTRVTTPLVTTVGLVATVGAGITAELGARRTSQEIDALEVMSVPPIPFLVTTRILGGLLAVTPLYALALISSYGASRLLAVGMYQLSPGAYDHYFDSFLVPSDVLTSYLQVLAMSVIILAVHCYYGFHVRGGPAGVGEAVGRSVRLSLVLVLFIQFAITIVFYPASSLRISR